MYSRLATALALLLLLALSLVPPTLLADSGFSAEKTEPPAVELERDVARESSAPARASDISWAVLSKIDPSILSEISHNDEIVVVIRLKPLPEDVARSVSGSYSLAVDALKRWAEATQEPVVRAVESLGGVVLNRFWLDNVVVARIRASQVPNIAAMQEVVRIFPNFEVRIMGPVRTEPVDASSMQQVVSWGILKIRAPEVWSLGFTGSGVRIAVIDTGVDIAHPALSGKMLTVIPGDPTYPGGWMEFDEYGNPVVSTPRDTHGHGTHCSGTALGGDTQDIIIGVAPGATLMHALALPYGFGTFAQVLAAMQWAVEPYYIGPGGEKVYTGLPAHVVSMSFGAYGYWPELLPAMRAMLLANIVPVAAIGNGGPKTSASPGNIWGVFGIGATDWNDEVAWWSSGEIVYWPVPPEDWPFFDVYPGVYIKPDFSAPGVYIISSVPGGGYAAWDGTSMATPHVAGLVALMIQAAGWVYGMPPKAVELLYLALNSTAVDLGEAGQDIRYGWGRVDAYDAVMKILEYAKKTGVEGYVIDETSGDPVVWATIIVLETGGVYKVDKKGYFRIPLDPGVYTLLFIAWGYYDKIVQVEVPEDGYAFIVVPLTRLPHGIVKGRVVGNDGVPVGWAVIEVLGTPVRTKTGWDGSFSIWLPEGGYDISIKASGYKPAMLYVYVRADETIDLGVITLERVPRVAILWDYMGALAAFFESRGWYARSYFDLEKLTDDVATGFYDVIVYSGFFGVPFPTMEVFMKFLGTAMEARVGIVWTDSWGPYGYGIKVLSMYLNDPPIVGYHFGSPVWVKVERRSPILRGYSVGDIVQILWYPDSDYSWFSGFSGVTIAKTMVNWGVLGDSIAYKVLGNGVKWVLLSSFAITQWNHPIYFTPQAWEIMYNAVVFAASKHLEVVLDKTDLHVGDTVTVYIYGAPPGEMLYVYLNGEPLGVTVADEQGFAVFSFRVPLIPGGFHDIEVYTENLSHYGFASFRVIPKIEVTPLEVKVPGSLRVEITGLMPRQLVYLFIDGNLLSKLRASELGVISARINLPLLEDGVHEILVLDESLESVLASSKITTSSRIEDLFAELAGLSVVIVREIRDGVVRIEFRIDETRTEILSNLNTLASNLARMNTTLTELLGLSRAVIKEVRDGVARIELSVNGTRVEVITSLNTLASTLTRMNATLTHLIVGSRGEIVGVITTTRGEILASINAVRELVRAGLPVSTEELKKLLDEMRSDIEDTRSGVDRIEDEIKKIASYTMLSLAASIASLLAIIALAGYLIVFKRR